jgi:acyl dehydratase
MSPDQPRDRRIYDSAPWTAPLLMKAALPAVPGLGRLPGIRREDGQTPDLALERPGVEVDLDRLAAYADTCHFALSDVLPVTYPHLPAFPLQLALMIDARFPFPPIGTVQVANTITQRRPLLVEERFDLAVHAAGLRAHRKGRLIDIVTTATVDDELVWQETTTVLRRGRGDPAATDPLPLRDLDPPFGPTRWLLPSGLGRRYAAVSGDRNPIHLFALTAKVFGFRRQIVHGMWTKARSLAALQSRLPDAYTVEVAFRRPILLPGSVRFGSVDDDGRLVFGVTGLGDASPHVVGVVTPDGR